mmetsp:Transcript_64561/g.152709  ORF Transcript_64561/g.152709 Transcript_64561/m.152709 type:complete len:246 (+) Transcript_64561:870-1607(+)
MCYPASLSGLDKRRLSASTPPSPGSPSRTRFPRQTHRVSSSSSRTRRSGAARRTEATSQARVWETFSTLLSAGSFLSPHSRRNRAPLRALSRRTPRTRPRTTRRTRPRPRAASRKTSDVIPSRLTEANRVMTLTESIHNVLFGGNQSRRKCGTTARRASKPRNRGRTRRARRNDWRDAEERWRRKRRSLSRLSMLGKEVGERRRKRRKRRLSTSTNKIKKRREKNRKGDRQQSQTTTMTPTTTSR